MDKKEKKSNIAFIIVVAAMLAVAAAVILKFVGLPKLNLDPGYDSRKEKREESQSEIMGEWVDPDNENFVIDIWRDKDGLFHAIINLTEEDGQVIFWEMDGKWQDSEGGFIYSEAKKTHAKYDNDGNLSQAVIYEDGSGSFTTSGDGLIWKDKKENMGDGITFSYYGEY